MTDSKNNQDTISAWKAKIARYLTDIESLDNLSADKKSASPWKAKIARHLTNIKSLDNLSADKKSASPWKAKIARHLTDIKSLDNLSADKKSASPWKAKIARHFINIESLDNLSAGKKSASAWKAKIARYLTDIESLDNLSADQKSAQIIHVFSATCAAVAVQPIPFADIFVLTPIQAYMAERLAAVRGIPMKESSATQLLKDLAKVIGLGMVAQQIALGLYKTVLPFLAGFTAIPLVYGLTYAIGNVLDQIFIARAKGKELSPEEIKAIWKAAKKEGKKKGKQYRKAKKGKTDEI